MNKTTEEILEGMKEVRVGDLVESLVPGVKWGTVARVIGINTDPDLEEWPYSVRYLNGVHECLSREEIRLISMDRAEGEGRR